MSIADDVAREAALELIARRFQEIYGVSLKDCRLFDELDRARANQNWGSWFEKSQTVFVVPRQTLTILVCQGLMRLNIAGTKYQITRKGRALLGRYYKSSLPYCHRQMEGILDTYPPWGELESL